MSKQPKDNLTKDERKALHSLKERQDIVITKADKGGAKVIWDVNNYVDECERQLNNYNFNRKLDHNPIQDHVNLINNTLDEFKGINELSPEIADGLKPLESKTPRLYMFPKIHKEGNPGGPVVSSVNCHTSKISKFVDYHIQPLAKELPSYFKDNYQVNFLDTKVYIDERNRLQTTLYRKPTDRQNYLYRTSEHPESWKANIPYSQALKS